MQAAGARRCQSKVRYRRSFAARVMRDSQGCAGAVRVRSAVSAGAVAVTPSGVPEHTCLCMPGTYAYSPPVPQRAGWLACHAGWRERWAGRGVAVPPISLPGLRRRSTACRCCSLPTACTSPCDAWSCSKILAQHCSSSMSWSQCNSCSWRSGHSGGRAVPHDGRAGSSDTSYGPFRVNI